MKFYYCVWVNKQCSKPDASPIFHFNNSIHRMLMCYMLTYVCYDATYSYTVHGKVLIFPFSLRKYFQIGIMIVLNMNFFCKIWYENTMHKYVCTSNIFSFMHMTSTFYKVHVELLCWLCLFLSFRIIFYGFHIKWD